MNSKSTTLLALSLLATAGCEWLLKFDRTPPTCRITAPSDSAMVGGSVPVQAYASDSVGVSRVDFYVDGAWFATDSNADARASWDASSLAPGSWHRLWCIAYDLSNNTGYSDTVSVTIYESGQRSIYHGTVELQHNYWFGAGFTAVPGESMIGDARTQTNGNISRFLWLDRANFALFRQGQGFNALHEQTNMTELSIRQAVPASDSFYIVLINLTGFRQTYWVRFEVE